MDSGIVIFVSLIYLLLLFVIAIYGNKQLKKGSSIVNNPLVYSLSLTVYCTVWTFYGSVGRASEQGLAFIPVYLGPTLAAPVIYMVIRKMILISKKTTYYIHCRFCFFQVREKHIFRCFDNIGFIIWHYSIHQYSIEGHRIEF
ncbi:MAG: hypothetical protein IPN79_07845 [Saprospiraceae bacterium]|nr:hypothetical protein [Saprospiraceae bacterium]